MLAELKPTSRENWRTVRFGDVVRNVDSSVKNPLEQGIERFVGLEHLDPESLHVKRWGNVADGTSFTRKFASGQVLFGKRRAYQRKAAVADFDGICSGDILVFEPKTDELLPKLLPFVVQSDGFFEHALGTSAGSLSPRTKWSDMARYEFVLPPKDEQRRIAEILWTLDEATVNFKNSYKLQEQLKQSLALEIFAKNYGDKTSLGLIGNWSSGGTPAKSRKDFWQGEIPWISPKDMKTDYLTDGVDKISEEAAKSGSKIIPENTILIVVRGMILAHTFPVAMTTRTMAFNQDMKALIVSDEFDSKFVFYWLQSKAKDILNLVSEATHGTKRLASETLFQLSVPKPSLEEQGNLALSLQNCDDALRLLEEHTQKLIQLKSQLLINLLSGEIKTYVQ